MALPTTSDLTGDEISQYQYKASLAQWLAHAGAQDDRLDGHDADIASLQTSQTAGMLGYATRATLEADLAHADGTLAIVTNDATLANNTTYRKSGASGTGSWVQASDRITALDTRVATAETDLATAEADIVQAQADIAVRLERRIIPRPITGPAFLRAEVDADNAVFYGLDADGHFHAGAHDVTQTLTDHAQVLTDLQGAAAGAAPTQFVLFALIGDSLAKGRGDSAQAPAVAAGVAYYYNYTTGLWDPFVEPVGNADTATYLGAFANEFYRQTGLGCLFTHYGQGGSALTAEGDNETGNGHWSAGSTPNNRALALARIQAAIAAAEAAAATRPWSWGGIITSLGTNDETELTAGTLLIADFTSDMGLLIEYFRASLGATTPFYGIPPGRYTAGDTVGFQAMRAAYDAYPATFDRYWLGAKTAVTFPGRSMMNADGTHYLQSGCDEIGRLTAVVAARHSIGI